MSANITFKNSIIVHKLFIILTVLFMYACSPNEHVKDLSDINIELSTLRFEQELFTCKSAQEILTLSEKHPYFYNVYTKTIAASNIYRPGFDEKDIAAELYKYIAHHNMDSLYKITQNLYGDFKDYEEELTTAAKYIKLYFPDEKITGINTFISTFHYGSIFDQEQKAFGIGLDMYLGREYEVYSLLNPEQFPLYRVKKFEPYRIVPNCIQTFVDYKVQSSNATNFIEQAVYEGKKMYLLDLLMPEYQDSLKINYLEGQIEWVEDQEENMWSYLVEREVLYSSDKNSFQKHYFNESPFTTPFGNESSPRTGVWIGWQIVKKYMNENPKVSISQLLADEDLNGIFRKSGYRP